MDSGAWWAALHEVTKSWTQLSISAYESAFLTTDLTAKQFGSMTSKQESAAKASPSVEMTQAPTSQPGTSTSPPLLREPYDSSGFPGPIKLASRAPGSYRAHFQHHNHST